MSAVILAIVVLVAALVMLSGVWVATVLIRVVARAKRPAASVQGRTLEDTGS